MTRKETAKGARKTDAARRRFLKSAAAAGGAATIGFPMIAKAAESTTFKFQSTWPTKDIFHEYALDFAKKVNDMTGGRLKIEVLPAGAVVKAFDLIDAVNKGTLDGGHGVAAYWYGKNTAYSLFGTGPSFGMDANMLLSWFEYGGGKQFYQDLHQNVMKFDVVGFIYGPMPTQPLGWFKKQVTSAADFKGLKYRTVGLSVDVFKEMGAAVVSLPGGEIVPALDRGLIDAAEFNNASSDRLLGFPTCRRSACCRATTSRSSASRSCSTRSATTHCRPTSSPSSPTPRRRRAPTCRGKRSTATPRTTRR